MNPFEKKSVIHYAFGIWVRFVITIIATIELPFLYIAERFILLKDRPQLWQMVAITNTKILFAVAGIDVRYEGVPEMYSGPVIYASNHPSWMDGFILLYIAGIQTTAVTAPFGSFPFPYNIWMKKSAAIDVKRDEQDEIQYPHSNSKELALSAATDAIMHKCNNIIVFPEGHLEREAHMHYVHSGTARISMLTQTPVQIIGLVGLESIVKNSITVPMKPGTLTITFGPLLRPPKIKKNTLPHTQVQNYQEKIAKEIKSILPEPYSQSFFDDPEPDTIGVFIDIDNTLYKGYSQKDFIRFLHEKKVIASSDMHKIFAWLGEESLHMITHEQMMENIMNLMEGWSTKSVKKYAKQFFNQYAKEHIESHILPHIKDHQEAGHHIVLVTEVITAVAEEFGNYIGAEAVIPTELEVKKNTYTGNILHLNRGKGKAQAAKAYATKHGFKLEHCYAYADSHTDTPLFNLVGHKTLVHPDSTLREYAKTSTGKWRKGWEQMA